MNKNPINGAYSALTKKIETNHDTNKAGLFKGSFFWESRGESI